MASTESLAGDQPQNSSSRSVQMSNDTCVANRTLAEITLIEYRSRGNGAEVCRVEPEGLFQHNRNAYIDHPEYVWSIFGDGANEAQIRQSALQLAAGSPTVRSGS